MTNGNGNPPTADAPPQLNVLAQYTKDLSFENPNAPDARPRASSARMAATSSSVPISSKR